MSMTKRRGRKFRRAEWFKEPRVIEQPTNQPEHHTIERIATTSLLPKSERVYDEANLVCAERLDDVYVGRQHELYRDPDKEVIVEGSLKSYEEYSGYSEYVTPDGLTVMDEVAPFTPEDAINAAQLVERLRKLSIRKLQHVASAEYDIVGAYRKKKDDIIEEIVGGL